MHSGTKGHLDTPGPSEDETELGFPQEDELSFRTIDSEDPTHENYETRKSDTDTETAEAQEGQIGETLSLDKQGQTRENKSTKPTGILKHKQKHSTKAESTPIKSPSTQNPKPQNDNTDPEWNVVSSTKRKAKTSPNKTTPEQKISIRKSYPRSTKKPLYTARDSDLEAGHKN
jgi:hypothetical protein